MADEQRALTLSIEDDIAIITFDTPNARANLMSESVVKEISEILRSLEDRHRHGPGLSHLHAGGDRAQGVQANHLVPGWGGRPGDRNLRCACPDELIAAKRRFDTCETYE